MPPRVLWEVLVIIVLKQTIQALEEVHKKRSDFIISPKLFYFWPPLWAKGFGNELPIFH